MSPEAKRIISEPTPDINILREFPVDQGFAIWQERMHARMEGRGREQDVDELKAFEDFDLRIIFNQITSQNTDIDTLKSYYDIIEEVGIAFSRMSEDGPNLTRLAGSTAGLQAGLGRMMISKLQRPGFTQQSKRYRVGDE